MKILDKVYISMPGFSFDGKLGKIINKREYREYAYLVVIDRRNSKFWLPESCLVPINDLFK